MKKTENYAADTGSLEKGMYISGVDKDIVTYDILMKTPNGGDYLSDDEINTLDLIFSFYAGNSPLSDDIVYTGPKGCRTGFYLLTRDNVTSSQAIALVQDSMNYIANFSGSVPGAEKNSCGNYLSQDLEGAKKVAADMVQILSGWSEYMLY